MKVLDEIEDIVRTGDTNLAVKMIKCLNLKQIPRANIWKVANLAQRCGLPMLALRSLHSYIYGENSQLNEPTEKELVEYGFCLLMVGAPKESLKILSKVKSTTESKVELYCAYASITQWNYTQATKHLTNFIDNYSDNNPYQLYVAKLNLALSHFYTDQKKIAISIIGDLTNKLDERKHKFLLANSHELLAQILIENQDIEGAKNSLEKAMTVLKDQKGVFNMLVEKSILTIKALENGFNSVSKKFSTLKKEAINNKQWELARQIDYIRVKFTKDKKLFFNTYFSTPYESYRQFMLDNFTVKVDLPDSFLVQNSSNITKKDTFELARGGLKGHKEVFSPGKVEHRLITCLAKDLYKPSRVATIHSEIYPDEYFNPLSSPLKIYQVVRRARMTIEKNDLPLAIQEIDGSYLLKIGDKANLQVTKETKSKSTQNHRVLYLKNHYKDECFSAKDAAKILDLSLRSATYIIKNEIGQSLTKVGSGPRTKYKFVS